MSILKNRKHILFITILCVALLGTGIIGVANYQSNQKAKEPEAKYQTFDWVKYRESQLSSGAKIHYGKAGKILQEMIPLQKEFKKNQTRFEELKEERISEFNKALKTDANNPLLWSRLASAYAIGYSSHTKETVEAANRAIELDGNYYALHLELAYYYLNLLKKYDLTISEFKKALSLNPNCWSCEDGLAQAYYALENYKESVMHAKMALEIYKKNKTTIQGDMTGYLESSIVRSQGMHDAYKK